MKIKDLLAKPEAWTQHAMATDKWGGNTNPKSKTACRWCLLGALTACYSIDETPNIALRIYHEVGGFVHHWNDSADRTHAEVVALVTKLDI